MIYHIDLFSGIGGFAYGLRKHVQTVLFCDNEASVWPVLAQHWPGVPICDDIRSLTGADIRSLLELRAENAVQLPSSSGGSNRLGLPELRAEATGSGPQVGHQAMPEMPAGVLGEPTRQDCESQCRTGWNSGPGQSLVADAAGAGRDAERGAGEAIPQPGAQQRPARRDSRVIVTAGFPCQDISHAGKGAGITGQRSGLWSELARILGELRPDYAILENVAAITSGADVVDSPDGPVHQSWLGVVLGDLAEIGYDCEWHCIPAAAVGAPHRRDRWWCVAYPQGERCGARDQGRVESHGERRLDPTRTYFQNPGYATGWPDWCVAQPGHARQQSSGAEQRARITQPRLGLLAHGLSERLARCDGWPEDPHPDVPRVATGVKNRKAKLMGLGNAVVPQVVEAIADALL